MQSTKEIADFLGCTVQAVNKAIKKACDAYDIDPTEFGTSDPQDRRIRKFSETEVEMILEFAPKPKLGEPRTVHAEPVTPSGMIVKSAQPVMGFAIQNLNINVTIANTQALEMETQSLNNVTAQAFGALKQLTSAELKASIAEMRAQNQHAVAGIQASAIFEAVQEIGGRQGINPQTSEEAPMPEEAT